MSIIMSNVTKSFGNPPVSVLKGVSDEIREGEMVSITGRSGSGKSTLLYIISSLDRPTAGDVRVNNISLFSLSSRELHEFRNQKMGFVFQFHHLLPELSALENILMPSLKMKLAQDRRSFAQDLLREFGIADKANNLPSQLSGGEQQRVAIARALVMRPAFLFADEPTGNLDSVNGELVMNLFKKINQQHGTTIVYVTHDKEFASQASRQIRLIDGQIASESP
ncbi:MAG: ABC transporter ATP-binding protein [Bdellovibrionaceae bacterium]|nr:ABC transporter ATP-binding protein [Pseudobdellovibrionaceae bacterium]